MSDPDPFDGLKVVMLDADERRLIGRALHIAAGIQEDLGEPDDVLIRTLTLKRHILGELEEPATL